jgi:hypothetical protein
MVHPTISYLESDINCLSGRIYATLEFIFGDSGSAGCLTFGVSSTLFSSGPYEDSGIVGMIGV